MGVNLLVEDGKEYIEIDVPADPIGISCKGVYYYRSGSTRQVLTGPALEAFLMRKRGATWDSLPLPAFTMAEVDDSVISRFKRLAANKGRIGTSLLEESKDVLLDKLHLKNGEYLTNAAMLLFSNDPENIKPAHISKSAILKMMLICCIKTRSMITAGRHPCSQV